MSGMTWNVQVGGGDEEDAIGDELQQVADAFHEGRTPPPPWSVITVSEDGTMEAVGGVVDDEMHVLVSVYDADGRWVSGGGGSGRGPRDPGAIWSVTASVGEWALVMFDERVDAVVDGTGTTRTVVPGHTGALIPDGGEVVALDADDVELGRVLLEYDL